MSQTKPVKVVALLSGGIDSVVAAWMAGKAGADIIPVHLDNSPYAPKYVKTRVIELVNRLAQLLKKRLKLYIIPHGKNQKSIMTAAPKRLICVLCRRMMYRLGEAVAEKEDAYALVTGESMAQVASQTLLNLAAETRSINIPVIRPLLCLDKEEIVKIAKKIGTYEISCKRDEGCYSAMTRSVCCYATPKYPETRANIKEVEEVEKKIQINELLNISMRNSEIREISFANEEMIK